MTTTADLREYLDAHGVDGAPTEPGWYVIEADEAFGLAHVARNPTGGIRYAFATSRPAEMLVGRSVVAYEQATGGTALQRCTRHALFAICPLAGRDLDAEVVAGVQAGRDDSRGLAEKAGHD